MSKPPQGHVSVAEAAERLGMPNRRAIDQAILRGSLPSKKDETGRRWIRVEDLTAYDERRRERRPRTRPQVAYASAAEAPEVSGPDDYWQALAEQLLIENVRLRARIAELERHRQA